MEMTNFATIELTQVGAIAKLALNRPEKLNAVTNEMITEINLALDIVEADDSVQVLVLYGNGRSFCAGFDLDADAADDGAGVAYWQPTLQTQFDVAMRFWHCPKPTIAAVHSHCLAYGCELAYACDITISAENGRFGEPELRFGSGILVMLMPWLTNPKRAKEHLLTGNDKISATEAEKIGLINQVVPDGTHLDAAMGMARKIAIMDTDAVQLTKQAINRTYEIMGMRQALAMAVDIDVQIESLQTPDRQQFKEIINEKGLKAAIAWRESRFS